MTEITCSTTLQGMLNGDIIVLVYAGFTRIVVCANFVQVSSCEIESGREFSSACTTVRDFVFMYECCCSENTRKQSQPEVYLSLTVVLLLDPRTCSLEL